MQSAEQRIAASVPSDAPNAPGLKEPSFDTGRNRLILLAKAGMLIGLVGSVSAAQSGMLTLHMAGHIITMNIAAPAAAWLLYTRREASTGKRLPQRLLLATGLQLLVFFLWHSPPAMALSMHSAMIRLAMLFILFGTSVWFWMTILEAVAGDRFEAIAALLVTGKLVCLIAVLFVFAPRYLYPGMDGMPAEAAMIGDQQLAGLLMLSACPLVYVGASTVFIARWLARLSSPNDPVQAE